jgi:hypothetical protein
MTTSEALAFLSSHQPMPGDRAISDAGCEMFVAVLNHFEAHPDERCLPFLVGAVSKDTGLGMYKHIRFVFHRFPLIVVGPHILLALRSADPGVRFWGVDWAIDCPWPNLLPDLERIVVSAEDLDAHELARAAIETISSDDN